MISHFTYRLEDTICNVQRFDVCICCGSINSSQNEKKTHTQIKLSEILKTKTPSRPIQAENVINVKLTANTNRKTFQS